jgi:3-deoxy-D-manno-octulosonic-acid transferase
VGCTRCCGGLPPLIRRYLKKRARKAPAYLQHWDERFGQARLPQAAGAIWIHAVSVGETRAALPLIQAIRQRWPDAPLLLTQMTPTGRETACQLYPDAEVRYLPYDYPGAVRDFLAVWQPRFGVLMETELWPNLLHAARQQGVPVFLANARLSEKSLRGYRRIQGLIGPALRDLTHCCAKPARCRTFAAIGRCFTASLWQYQVRFHPASRHGRTGSAVSPAHWQPPVFICASTRDGEEQLILQAWQQAEVGNTLLLLVPRHPERQRQRGRTGTGCCRATPQRQQQYCCPHQRVAGRQHGRAVCLLWLCRCGFCRWQPAAAGWAEPDRAGQPRPAGLFGPSMFNFAQASELALQAGAALQVADAAPWCSRCSACCRTRPAVSRCTAPRWRLPLRIVVPASALSSYCRRTCLPDPVVARHAGQPFPVLHQSLPNIALPFLYACIN